MTKVNDAIKEMLLAVKEARPQFEAYAAGLADELLGERRPEKVLELSIEAAKLGMSFAKLSTTLPEEDFMEATRLLNNPEEIQDEELKGLVQEAEEYLVKFNEQIPKGGHGTDAVAFMAECGKLEEYMGVICQDVVAFCDGN